MLLFMAIIIKEISDRSDSAYFSVLDKKYCHLQFQLKPCSFLCIKSCVTSVLIFQSFSIIVSKTINKIQPIFKYLQSVKQKPILGSSLFYRPGYQAEVGFTKLNGQAELAQFNLRSLLRTIGLPFFSLIKVGGAYCQDSDIKTIIIAWSCYHQNVKPLKVCYSPRLKDQKY